MSGADLMVRMGELAVSAGPDDVLTSIGLGSCIGLALVDAERRIAGLAHVMLPARPERSDDVAIGKFADTAVPALLDAVVAAGARRARLATYMVGGAQMFTFGGRGMDVGSRNDQAVREALAALQLRVRADATGGTKGRTMRVHAADGTVTFKESGGVERTISTGGAAPAGRRPTASGPTDRPSPAPHGRATDPAARRAADGPAAASARRPAATTSTAPSRQPGRETFPSPARPRTTSVREPGAGRPDATRTRDLPDAVRPLQPLRGV